jgi:hypothetical protein
MVVSARRGASSAARRWVYVVVGLAAGFSGLAVVGTILTGVPLALFEGALLVMPVGVAVAVVRRVPKPVAREVWRVVRAGILAGALATLAYDVTRTILAAFDPSPYSPFEAIRMFGLGVVPATAPIEVVMTAGFAIHLLNGSSFGVVYSVFAGRGATSTRGALTSGIAWGLTLELLQSILYPGWLHITTVLREFLVISGLGHIVYGATLGTGVRRLLRPGRGGDHDDN